MAGATNRQLKTAGIPKAAMAQIRVHAGGRLSLKLALDVAERHGIAIPDRAHAFMAARDLKERKVALQAAGARGADASLANRVAAPNAAAVNKPLTWDKIATGYALNNGAARLEKNGKKWTLVTKDGERHEMPRKASFDHAERKLTELARQKSVSRPVDAAKGRGKSGAMGNTSGFKRTSDGLYEGKIGDTHVRVTRGTVGTNRYGDHSKTVEWKARANGRVIADGHGTMSGAIAQARRALGVDASVTGKAPVAAKEKTVQLPAALTPSARKAIREMGYVADERGGDAITTKARDRRALASNRPRRTGHALILSKTDGTPVTARDVEHIRAAIETSR